MVTLTSQPGLSNRSERTIALSEATIAFLRRVRVRQAEQRLLLGEAWQKHDLVVCEPDGRPAKPGRLSLVRRLSVYAHAMPTQQEAAAREMDDVFGELLR